MARGLQVLKSHEPPNSNGKGGKKRKTETGTGKNQQNHEWVDISEILLKKIDSLMNCSRSEDYKSPS